MTLEQLCSDRAAAVQAYVNTFAPMERTLKDEKFLGGAQPNYADYALFGSLQWANCISGTTFPSRRFSRRRLVRAAARSL